MATPTRFKRVQIGDRINSATGDLEAFGYTTLSQSVLIGFASAGAAVNVCVIPANSQIIEIYVNVITAFNSSGTDLVNIGVSGTSDLFANGIDLSLAGRVLATSDVSQLVNYDNTGATQITVQALYAQSIADASAGSARVTVVYCAGNNLI